MMLFLHFERRVRTASKDHAGHAGMQGWEDVKEACVHCGQVLGVFVVSHVLVFLECACPSSVPAVTSPGRAPA